jgi:osmotically-inducible protein OsmY
MKRLVLVLSLALSIPTFADSAKPVDLTPQLAAAGVNVDGFKAVEVGGIVVLRGRVNEIESAQNAAISVRNLGYTRVANLIQVAEPVDDEKIERTAERALGLRRSLDGCNIHVDSDHGVVRLGGTVQHELQKDVAISVVRNISGVRAVKSSLQR